MTTTMALVGVMMVVGTFGLLFALSKGWRPRVNWVGVAIATGVLLLILGTGSCVSSCRTEKKAAEVKKVAELERARTNSPAVSVPAYRRPKTPRTFDIPQTGFRIWLEQSPKTYPKFGPIIEETPSRERRTNEPGIDRKFGPEPPGFWTFLPDPPGSVRGVEIYNRWDN